MSAPEHAEAPEQKCRIKAVRNAKGDAQFEVSVVEGFDEAELERVRLAAVAQYQLLVRELGGVS
jgi:hypothetical protein